MKLTVKQLKNLIAEALGDFNTGNFMGMKTDKLPTKFLMLKKQELEEMEELLSSRGYNPKYAQDLQDEEMGPYELEHILKNKPGSVGSLERTHGIYAGDFE